jgi:hypothetical protein
MGSRVSVVGAGVRAPYGIDGDTLARWFVDEDLPDATMQATSGQFQYQNRAPGKPAAALDTWQATAQGPGLYGPGSTSARVNGQVYGLEGAPALVLPATFTIHGFIRPFMTENGNLATFAAHILARTKQANPGTLGSFPAQYDFCLYASKGSSGISPDYSSMGLTAWLRTSVGVASTIVQHGATYNNGAGELIMGAWQHIAVIYDGAALTLVREGMRVSQVAHTGIPTSDAVNGRWLIGRGTTLQTNVYPASLPSFMADWRVDQGVRSYGYLRKVARAGLGG